MFLKAARHAELDTLRGVSANVMCGQEGLFGTSSFQVVLDIEEMQKLEATSEYKYSNIDEEIEISQEWSEKLTHAEIISFCRQNNNYHETILYIEKYITNNKKNNEVKSDTNNEVKSDTNSEVKQLNELLYNQPFY